MPVQRLCSAGVLSVSGAEGAELVWVGWVSGRERGRGKGWGVFSEDNGQGGWGCGG